MLRHRRRRRAAVVVVVVCPGRYFVVGVGSTFWNLLSEYAVLRFAVKQLLSAQRRKG